MTTELDIYTNQPIDIVVTFRTRDGVLADPTDVEFELRQPDGEVVAYLYSLGEVERESQGVYRLTTNPELSGTWDYRAAGSDVISGVYEGSFVVRPSVFS